MNDNPKCKECGANLVFLDRNYHNSVATGYFCPRYEWHTPGMTVGPQQPVDDIMLAQMTQPQQRYF